MTYVMRKRHKFSTITLFWAALVSSPIWAGDKVTTSPSENLSEDIEEGCRNNDPREEGFFSGMGGLMSDCYEQRRNNLHNQAEEQQRRNEELQADVERMTAERNDRRQAVVTQRAALSDLQHDIDQMQGQLNRYGQQNPQLSANVANLEQQLADLERERIELDLMPAADPARLQELEEERERLRSQIRVLTQAQH